MLSGTLADLWLTWLPIIFMLLLAGLGALRGGWRELLVSVSIVLAALIIQQWAMSWAEDITAILTGSSLGVTQFTLSLLLMGLTVLVVGYFLGSALVKRRPTASARLAGGVLGLLNGAAIAGWVLRYGHVIFEGARDDSPFVLNPVSTGFMVWAGWFPVALVAIGALLAIISPLRNAQSAVARPSAESDWPQPHPAPPLSVSIPVTPHIQSPTPYTPPPYTPPPAYQSSPGANPIRSDLAPTLAMPVQESPRNPIAPSVIPAVSSPMPPPYSSPTSLTEQRPIWEQQRTEAESELRPQPNVEQEAAGTPHSALRIPHSALNSPTWLDEPAPSWLMGEAVSRVEVASESTQLIPETPSPSPTQAASGASLPPIVPAFARVTEASEPDVKKCGRCGAELLPNAQFCTECGTRVGMASNAP